MRLMTLLLPEPVAPKMATVCPGSAVKLTPLSTGSLLPK